MPDFVKKKFEQSGSPFALIAKPHALFDDPHLNTPGGAITTKVPLLPLRMDGDRLGVRLQQPQIGEHTRELLTSLRYSKTEIKDLKTRHIAL